MIRPATAADAAAICAIWNPVIRDTLITFNPVEKTEQDIAVMIAEKACLNHPFLLVEVDGVIGGFATYGQFRSGAGYRHTVEHTIILGPEARGRRLGRQLMTAICDHAAAHEINAIWAGCSAMNQSAVDFHLAIGFRRIAVLPKVGFKFGRWIDLILLQKML